jgi:serine/threonine protein kinase
MSSNSIDTEGFCHNLLDFGKVNVFKPVGVVMIILGILYIVTTFIIIYFIKIQRRYAKGGDHKALQSAIFPIYVRILWLNAFVNLYIGLISFAFDFHPYGDEGSVGDKVTFATMWGLQHAVVEGVALLLMQKGLGQNAAKMTMKYAIIWGLVTFFAQVIAYNATKPVAFSVSMCWNFSLLLFYFILWQLPQRRLYRRPAAIIYSKMWCLYRLYCMIASCLYYFPQTFATGNCAYIFGSLYGFALLEPFLLYFTFLQDSRWWQGLDISQGKRTMSSEEIRSPLQGVDINHHSALSLAASLDTLGVSSSRSVNKAVRLLNFAYISLDRTRMLGSGSFSKVYIGKYRSKKCAIKLIFTIDLTQDIISRVAAEAQLLSSIKHPNVVEILGVSVLPPSVCILLELCQYGSLADVVGGTGSSHLRDAPGFIRDFLMGGPMIGRSSPRGLSLSWTDRLFLAVGCTKGLAALHRMAQNICHRDVKSYNFLVDGQLNAKISDLELGITDDLLVTEQSRVKKDLIGQPQSVVKNSTDRRHLSVLSMSSAGGSSAGARRTNSDGVSELAIGESAIAADEFLANWAAPEVIKDARHSQASDIYSLGLVLWEILSGSVPFNEVRRQDDIRFKVLHGERPEIAECFVTGPEMSQFNKYVSIIQKCWTQCPEDRPTAEQVLAELEMLLQDRCYNILRETDAVPMESPTGGSRLALSIFFAGRNNAVNIAIADDQIPSIVNRLQEESDCLIEFSQRMEGWLLVLPDSNLTMIWASMQFEDAIGVSNDQIQGRSFAELPCFERISQETKSTLAGFFQKMRESKIKGLNHAVMELETLHAFSLRPEDEDDGARKKLLTLFSVHAFPITNRSYKLTHNIHFASGGSRATAGDQIESNRRE